MRNANILRGLSTALVIGLVLVLLSPHLGAQPVQAECGGNLICEFQQAGEELMNSIITPLKDWTRFTASSGMYSLMYSLAKTVAEGMWSLGKALITVGVGIGVLTDWLISSFFQPMISTVGTTFRPMVGIFFFVAMVLLGCTYVLAAFVRLNVVHPRNMVLWWIAGGLFFSVGSNFYASMRDLGQSLTGAFYASTLETVTTSPFEKMAQDDTSSSVYMPSPCQNFSKYIPSARLNGLDVGLAYLAADGWDVLGDGAQCMGGAYQMELPRSWFLEYGYFDFMYAPDMWLIGATACEGCTLTQQVDADIATMQRSTNKAFSAVARLVQSIPITWFALVEQLVSLSLAIAQGLTFISFACAMLFAFFRRTEAIAWSVIDNWISLIIQTVIVAMIQALVIALYIGAANTGSPLVTLAVSIIGFVLMFILLVSALKAVWNAFNKLFEAFGSATGNVFITPGAAAGATVGAAGLAGGFMLGGAASVANATLSGVGAVAGGANALASGSTWAQAAGVTFGGSPALDGAAFSLARLPGLRNTALGEAAQQYIEGSAAQQIGKTIIGAVPIVGEPLQRVGGASLGAALLTDHNPQHAEAHIDPDGNPYWQQPMLRKGAGNVMSGVLTGPSWEDGAASQIGRGGIPLRRDDGAVYRREDIAAEAVHPTHGQGGIKFSPTTTLNNDGNLDETISEDMKRALAGERHNATDGASRSLESAATRLEGAAQNASTSLTNAANALSRSVHMSDTQKRMEQIEGRMTQSGSANVAQVMAGAVDAIHISNTQDGQIGATNDMVSNAMAGAMGINPVQRDGRTIAPIERDVPRFGMFADQAVAMGLNGKAVERIITEVKSNPDGHLSEKTRDALIHREHDVRGQSWQDSVSNVGRLEHTARMLPGEISAYGTITVMHEQSSTDPVTFVPPAPLTTLTVFTSPAGEPPHITNADPVVFTPPHKSSTEDEYLD
jgi:hypothetical protein